MAFAAAAAAVKDVRYAAAAAACVLVALMVHLGPTDSTRLHAVLFVGVTAAVVWQLWIRATSNTPVDEITDDLRALSSSIDEAHTLSSTPYSTPSSTPYSSSSLPSSAKHQVIDPDEYSLRTASRGLKFAGMHPDVAWALLQLEPYLRGNRGTIGKITDYTELFFEMFYDVLELSDAEDQEVLHKFRTLKDVRADIVNAMTTLLYAKPHAHAVTARMRRAIETIKWRTYRCIKTLHNKFGAGALRAEDRAPPYAFDARVHADARYSVHTS